MNNSSSETTVVIALVEGEEQSQGGVRGKLGVRLGSSLAWYVNSFSDELLVTVVVQALKQSSPPSHPPCQWSWTCRSTTRNLAGLPWSCHRASTLLSLLTLCYSQRGTRIVYQKNLVLRLGLQVNNLRSSSLYLYRKNSVLICEREMTENCRPNSKTKVTDGSAQRQQQRNKLQSKKIQFNPR
jgi:hypothetical protein